MSRITISKVNEALRRLPGAEDAEIVRGRDYWYFAGSQAAGFYSQSVYVPRLSDLTVSEWVKEYEDKRDYRR